VTAESVAASFATYRARVLPPNASDTQVLECRRAFYAGAYFLLMNVAYNIGDDSIANNDGVAQLERLKDECEAFAITGGMPLPTATPHPVDVARTTEVDHIIPDSTEIRPLLNDLGERIGSELPNGWGFNLMLFEFGLNGSLFYVSSANCEDVMALMREFIRQQTP
jgi:hypothetical protein